ncbi:MAG: DUF4382 domain-containing protein [Cyanobacteria bacterium Co-bin8]|nr:DUF4382 domain-containing protein [Cyanobacteria bacterium Co-bin8]
MQETVIRLARAGLLAVLLPLTLQACGGDSPTATDTASPDPQIAASGTAGEGTLIVRANGEDFVREGFTTSDGWEMEFDNVYVTLANVTAYQTDPPFDPQATQEINAQETVSVSEPITVDLAEGDEAADPVMVAEVKAPEGRYNALSWEMVAAPEGPAEGYSIVLQGTATRDGQTLPFVLRLSEELAFTCGDFVGDQRKGILSGDDEADLEATFHFDHLFGDGEAPADDEINTGALGFDPLAALAEGGRVEANSQQLSERLAPADYQKLLEILPSLGHVGEGHCEETNLTA